MAAGWRIELLGWLRASRGTLVHMKVGTQKTASLLAYLATHPRAPHPREELAELLWPEAAAATGRHNLRTAIYAIRGALEPPGDAPGSVLVASREAVSLAPGSFSTDVADFERAAAEAAAGDAGALRRALAVYRGELLPGFFESWVVSERHRLADLHATLLKRLLDDLGDAAEAVDVAHRLIACDPLDEEAHVSLMRAYAAQGRVGAALAQYQALAEVLRDELGVEPSDEAQEVARDLRSKPAVTARTPAYAGAATAVAPAHRPDAGPARRRAPAPLTRFVGREAELERLSALLHEGARLVTVAGPGGIGKTRLAAELVRRAERDCAAAHFVELADVLDPAFVADAVAAAIGLVARPGTDIVEQVAGALAAEPRPLLVLDNCEQVADAAGDLARELLDLAPALRIVATSRGALAVGGEVELRLGPLAVPADWRTAVDLARSPSVALYVDRVRARRPEFALTRANAAAVARLCTKLEGIPLALELAAARERVLPAPQLVARLDRRFEVLASSQRDVPERHRTLSAAIDWSYRALGDEARRIFERLSVFRGGFTVEEAEAVCGSPRTLEAVERMCEVSLVEAYDYGELRRFRMLETIREFAADRLDPAEAADLHRRHAAVMLALAERARVYLFGPDQGAWLVRLDAEFENLRAALDWSQRSGDTLAVARISASLHRYWISRARYREARRWLRRALEAGEDRLPRRLRAWLLRLAGEYALSECDDAEADRLLCESLAMSEADGDEEAVALVLGKRAHLAIRGGAFEEGRRMLLDGLEIAARRGDPRLRAGLANVLGVFEARQRNYERALELFSESLVINRAAGDESNVVVLLYNLGYLATIAGWYDRAAEYLDECLTTSRRIANAVGEANALTFLGLLELRRGRYAEASANCRAAAEQHLESGDGNGLTFAVEGLALALVAEGRDEAALRLFGHAGMLRERTAAEPLFEDPSVRENAVEAASARVGAAAAERLLAEGRAASIDDLLAA
jgi:predicted ATPase/DNA-binding SARP family transcriptional activator